MMHYLGNKVGVVDFANAQGLVIFQSPRARKDPQALKFYQSTGSHFIFELITFLSKTQNNCQIKVVFQKFEGKTTTLKFWIQKLEEKTTTLIFWFKDWKKKPLPWNFAIKVEFSFRFSHYLIQFWILRRIEFDPDHKVGSVVFLIKIVSSCLNLNTNDPTATNRNLLNYVLYHYGHPMKPYFIEIPNLWAWQTIWADKFWGIWVLSADL